MKEIVIQHVSLRGQIRGHVEVVDSREVIISNNKDLQGSAIFMIGSVIFMRMFQIQSNLGEVAGEMFGGRMWMLSRLRLPRLLVRL